MPLPWCFSAWNISGVQSYPSLKVSPKDHLLHDAFQSQSDWSQFISALNFLCNFVKNNFFKKTLKKIAHYVPGTVLSALLELT